MRPRSRSDVAALAAGAVLLAVPALAADKPDKLTVYGNLTAAVSKGFIAVGPEWEHKNSPPTDLRNAKPATSQTGWFLRLLAKVPVSSGDESQAVIDGSATTWRAVLEGNWTWRDASENAPSNPSAVLGATVEWGVAPFEYFTSAAATAPTTVYGHSFDFELHARYFHASISGLQVAPQGRIRYARDYKAAAATGVVVNGTISTVSNMVLSAPAVKPTLSFQLAMPAYDPALLLSAVKAADLPLAFAPSLSYSLSGADGEVLGAQGGRLRAEMFVYWFPAGQKGGGRIGVAPFFDVRLHGTDDRSPAEYGALLQLRLGANLLEY